MKNIWKLGGALSAIALIVAGCGGGSGSGSVQPSTQQASFALSAFATPTAPPIKPSTADTGVQAGVTLTVVNGDLLANTAGATIEKKDVRGVIKVTAPNVTIKNCKVQGVPAGYPNGKLGKDGKTPETVPFIDATDANASGLNVLFTEVCPQTPGSWTVGFTGHSATIRYSKFHDLQDGMRLQNHPTTKVSNVDIQQNLIYGLTYYQIDVSRAADKQTHNDCIQLAGTVRGNIRWNNLRAYCNGRGSSQPPPNMNPTPSGASQMALSAIMFNNESVTNIKVSDMAINDNWIGGGYTPLNCGDPGLEDANLGNILRNKFDRGSGSGNTLRFRADQTVNAGVGDSYNQNVYEDNGQPVNVRKDA